VVGALLAHRHGLGFADVDAEVQAAAGATIAEPFRRERGRAYRARQSAALASCLATNGRVVATSDGAVLAAGDLRCIRDRGLVPWLQAAPEVQLRRLEGCGDRPLLEGGDRLARLRALAEVRDPLYREVADIAV